MSLASNSFLFGAAGAAGGAGYTIDQSIRFDRSDTSYLERDATDSGSDVYKCTLSWWMKRGHLGYDQAIFNFGTNNALSGWFRVDFRTADDIRIYGDTTGGYLEGRPSRLLRDTNSWYHCVVSLDTTQTAFADQCKWYINGVQVTDFSASNAYPVNTALQIGEATKHYVGAEVNSLGNLRNYFDGYLAEVHVIEDQVLDSSSFGKFDANGQWVPIEYTGTHGNNGYYLKGDTDNITLNTPSNGYIDSTVGFYLNANPPIYLARDYRQIFVDAAGQHGGALSPSTAWQLDDVLQFAVDSDSGKIWVGLNNTWYESGDPGAGTNHTFQARPFSIQAHLGYGYNSTDFQLQVASSNTYTPPSGFTFWDGATSGSWKVSGTDTGAVGQDVYTTPIPRTGKNYIETVLKGGLSVWATIGFMYPGISAIEFVDSAGSNNFSGTNIEMLDVFNDTPTINTEVDDTGIGGQGLGNYSTFDYLSEHSQTFLSEGNLRFAPTTGYYETRCGTVPIEGKQYAEFWWDTLVGVYSAFGVLRTDTQPQRGDNTGFNSGIGQGGWAAGSFGYYGNTGQCKVDGSTLVTASTWTRWNVLGIEYDSSTGEVFVYKEGAIQNSGNAVATLDTSYKYVFAATEANSYQVNANFGSTDYIMPPTGSKSNNTKNLTDPTIPVASAQFDALDYSGTGAALTISGLSFAPDFVWIKRRNSVESHTLFDTVRGAGKELVTDSTGAEYDAGTGAAGSLIAFNSDGFDLGTRSSTNGGSTTNSAWSWNAGGTTESNADGDITSDVRVNTSAGFSIVSWTCNGSIDQSIGHGLGSTPEFMIFKNRTRVTNWTVYHASVTTTTQQLLYLNTSAAVSTYGGGGSTWWGALPTSSTFSVGDTGTAVNNTSGDEMITYCFTPVEGFSAFGKFEGNGTADGPSVNCGFSPRFLMIKNADDAYDWLLFDNERQTYNVQGPFVYPNLNNAEADIDFVDFTSTGFKVRNTNVYLNADAKTISYMAFADFPFKYGLAQ